MTDREKPIVRTTARLAAVLSLLLALSIPLGYFILGYGSTALILETEAHDNALFASQLISANPEFWRFQQYRLEEFLSRRLGKEAGGELRRILDSSGREIAQSHNPMAAPFITRSHDLYDSGEVVARLEISRSLRPLLWKTLLVAILALLPAGAFFAFLKKYPLRALSRALRELAEEQERFRAIFDSSLMGIVILDRENRILHLNHAYEAMSQFSENEMQGTLFLDLADPGERQKYLQHFRELLANARDSFQMEVSYPRKDGTPLWIELVVFAIKDAQGHFLNCFAMVADITGRRQAEEELRRSEEQLRQASKMEAVGRLAGGVAHDFNNILTGILGHSELLLEQVKEEPLRHDIVEILHASERAASLTRQLLAFGRKQVLQPKPLNLNELLANMEKMLRRIIGEDIEIVTFMEPELGTVRVDPGQMEQVILNLAANARDAMPQGGKLTIETLNVELDADYARRHQGVQPGSYVLLAVSDTGTGMDEETRAQIFEPFFTTKELGMGIGLGLPSVYGIVKQTGGHIWVYSEPGQGTTFKIYLPRMDQPEAAAAEEVIPAQEHGPGTVLLVEDEDLVRKIARKFLEKNGYAVLEAASGEEALRLSQDHQGRIDLVLTDVIMPQMSGRDLVARLSGPRPETKVLYMSGHTENAIVHHGVLDPGIAFIQKPFRYESLMRKVSETLAVS